MGVILEATYLTLLLSVKPGDPQMKLVNMTNMCVTPLI